MTQLSSEVCCRKPAPDADMHVYPIFRPTAIPAGFRGTNCHSMPVSAASAGTILETPPSLVPAESNTTTDQVKRNKRGCSSDHKDQAAPSRLAAASSGIELTEDSSDSSSGSKTS
ncbi:hypothetical protein NM208_g7331 [Fusarium decemcellulare]|uniref:Uncharacterized protein n=1 Tax=Fusarium decemcellulare TaxID=57161 RepID=A0ACC1S9T6_9HYPO|nr:hypothetical protein NM208_g7331 [Fusarium decemcellulare]